MAPDYLLQLARSDPESTHHRNQKVCQLIERLALISHLLATSAYTADLLPP